MTAASDLYSAAREHHASARRLLDAAVVAYLADDIGGGFSWEAGINGASYVRAPTVDSWFRRIFVTHEASGWSSRATVASQPGFGGFGHDFMAAGATPRAALADLLDQMETDEPGHVHPDDLADVLRTLRAMVQR